MVKLKVAIQKSGRLNEDTLELLNQLMAQASNFPLEVLYLRNSDIPHYVEDGIVDVAIIRENTVIEKRANVLNLLDLGF